MARRALTSILLVLLLAGVPATAFAGGGAGDNQYQDPLAAPSAPKTAKKKAPTAPVQVTAPASSTSTTTAPASSAAPVAQPAPAQQLPRTGTPAGAIGLGGATMLLAGLALRRRTATE